ncbi:MAG: AbrB/MazE/SpoVT family DNA-binding domain-containing protein [Rhizomicrobium sp.]
MKTRYFKSGNSQAVRIPAELAFEGDSGELEITRAGDEILIRPAIGSLTEAVALLRRLPKPSTIELLERTEVPERDWD